MVWQISCVVYSEEKCEQWVRVKCPWPLSVKPLNDIYYSTTVFAYHLKWFIQWVIWHWDTTVQYALILSCMCFLLIIMINWCYSGIITYLVYSYLMPRDYYIKINLFKYLSVMNQPLDHFVDKSVNQSIKNLWLTVLSMRITNGPVTTSDFIWCTDYDSLCYYPWPWW